jgi:type VI secretion system secreted protein VgrG
LTRYHLEVVPWLWLLTCTTDCRIFQALSVTEIITAIFDELGVKDYALELQGTYEAREYCVQYRETTFDFVSRLMEEEGIWYFFRHEEGKHTLVLADDPGAVQPCPGRTTARFNPETIAVHEDEFVFSVSHEHSLHSTHVALRDFNFETPITALSVERDEQAPFGPFERYDYPGRFADAAAGNRYAGMRIQEQTALRESVSGAGNCRGFTPGYKFDLKEHPRRDFNRSWKILSVTHEGEEEGSYQPGRGTPGNFAYTNRFEAIRADTQYRPPRTAPHPVIAGAQTAVVTGPEGEEIHTDTYGRVKVHFHWDRLGKMDDTCSCWVRVSQGWAGKNWGMFFLPRVGHEVIVEFLEGDPDRPLITGRVYNAEAMPPHPLPANKTLSGIKTRSSKGAGTENLNTIRFEDKKGEEQLFIQAEKNQDIRVKADCFEWVGSNRHLVIKKDYLTKIENNLSETISSDRMTDIGRDSHVKVGGKEVREVAAGCSIKVGGDRADSIGANHAHEVTQVYELKAMGARIEAQTGLELKCGGSSIVLTPAAIFITGGPLVNINTGSGPPVVATPVSALSPAAPNAPEEADVADPAEMAKLKAEQVTKGTGKYGTTPVTPHKPPEEEDEETETKTWIEIKLVDADNKEIPGERYRVELPDGTVAEGTLDGKGFVRIDGVEPGNAVISFPDLLGDESNGET